MSNIYNLEPPTKGKVLLHTNLGDLEIELWPKEAPKACRNFVQLAAEGYYDGTIFHRVIKDYIAQGGDPTGTGDGGSTIYGEPFKDEFHQRLKFTRRGLVACANQNEPHTNGSQFFITLDKADWLNNRNTIFGRVVGDTVYNMLRFNDLPVDDNDRPLEPPVIREAEVVWNPFEDLAPRVDKEAVKAEAEAARMADERRKRAAGRTKNLALLSFGDEAEADDEETTAAVAAARKGGAKSRSAHDVLSDERLAKEQAVEEDELARLESERPAKRPKQTAAAAASGADALARAKAAVGQAAGRARDAAAEAEERAGVAAAADGAAPDGADGGRGGDGDDGVEGAAAKAASAAFGASMRAKVLAAKAQAGDEAKARPKPPPRAAEPTASEGGDEEEEDGDGARRGSGRGAGGSGGGGGGRDFLAERRAEMETMRQEATNKSYGRVGGKAEVADADLLKPWQLQRATYKARKQAGGNREKDTLARLNKFTAALRGPPAPTLPKAKGSTEPKELKQGAAAAAAAGGEGGEGGPADDKEGGKGYAGKVDAALDHRMYMPAAWRVDAYLDAAEYAEEEEAAAGGGGGGQGGSGGSSLASLRTHRFEAAKDRKDNMTRDMDNLDDYTVYDPLLEKGKGKWSAANQKEKKRGNEWAGKANM